MSDLSRILQPGNPDDRMDAYYYSFERTGIGVIDQILSAVAIAGKGSHHTDMWADDSMAALYPDRLTHEQRIQRAADDAAAVIRDAIGGDR